MKNILGIIALISSNFQLSAAHKNDAPPQFLQFDYTLNVVVYWDGQTWMDSAFVSARDDGNLMPLVNNGNVRVIQNERGLELVSEEGSNHFFERGSVKNLRVKMEPIRSNRNCPSVKLQIDQLEIIRNLNLNHLKSIKVDYQEFNCEFEINFPKFGGYPDWLNQNSLKSFALIGEYQPDFDLASIYSFSNLETLEIPFYMGENLSHFPKLNRLKCYGATSGLIHQTMNLEQLVSLEEYPGQYLNQYGRSHAQRYFSNIVAIQSKKKIEPSINGTEFERLLHQIKTQLPEKWTKNGEILIFEYDLPGYAPELAGSDTLLHGTMKRGKLRGIWTYKLKSQYERMDEETHHINFGKKVKLKFPDDGAWSLTYTNGKTAVEGSFENGQKVGEWRLYKENGELKAQQFYTNDTLVRNITKIDVRGVASEARTYFITESSCLQSFSNGEVVFFTYIDWDFEQNSISYSSHGLTIKDEETGNLVTYKKGTDFFKHMFEKHFISKLYPEFNGKEFPYRY